MIVKILQLKFKQKQIKETVDFYIMICNHELHSIQLERQLAGHVSEWKRRNHPV